MQCMHKRNLDLSRKMRTKLGPHSFLSINGNVFPCLVGIPSTTLERAGRHALSSSNASAWDGSALSKKSVQQFPLSLFTWKGFSWTGRPGYLERCWDQRAYQWYSVLGYYWLFYCANWFLIVFLHFLCLIPPALVLILPKMASPITSVMRPNIRLDSPNVSVVQMSS